MVTGELSRRLRRSGGRSWHESNAAAGRLRKSKRYCWRDTRTWGFMPGTVGLVGRTADTACRSRVGAHFATIGLRSCLEGLPDVFGQGPSLLRWGGNTRGQKQKSPPRPKPGGPEGT